MSISIIVAKSENSCIGNAGDLPWHLPADLKHFKETTDGKTVVMGRKTFESIVSMLGKPLPNRKNIIVTRNTGYKPEGAKVAHSLQEVLRENKDVFVIGGAEIYKQALRFADKLYITNVHTHIDGDAFFPDINENEWEVTKSETHESDEKNKYAYTFLEYERRK